ncbi:MAG: hypothetical protein L3K03_08345 [Thermoplasmata archaeon]|nr:hypothetical protein [Thermoplasmata archaeon]
MIATKTTKAIWTIPAVLAVMLFLLPGSVGATPVAATSSNVTQWAYGAQENVSFSIVSNSTTYTVNASFGYSVIFTQTNTSNSTFQLEIQRTLGFAFVAKYTGTDALGQPVTANLQGTGLSSESGFGNFTNNGTVYVNGSAVPALAIETTAHRATASLVESSVVNVGRRTATAAFNASLTSQGHATFSPALGLVPNTVTPGESWNASSTVSHVGAVTGAWSWSKTGLFGVTTTGGGSLSANTTVTAIESVLGSDVGTTTLNNGITGDVVVLSVVGPLQPHDGVLWLPGQADLFSLQHPGYSNTASGVVDVLTDKLDWVPHPHGHLGLDASATGFTPQPDASSVAGTSVSSGATAAVGTASAAPSGSEIQAQPETVPQAQNVANCLVSGKGNCGSTVTTSTPVGRAGGVVFAAAVIAVVAVLGMLLVSRRRTPKSPAKVSSVYQPAGGAPVSGSRPPASPAAPGGATDPLDHLW